MYNIVLVWGLLQSDYNTYTYIYYISDSFSIKVISE